MRQADPDLEERRRRTAVLVASIVLVAIVAAGWIGACRAAERAGRERTGPVAVTTLPAPSDSDG